MEKIITKYVVGDKEFKSEADAIEFLKKIENKKIENQKIALEKERRRKEVEEAYCIYKNLKSKYEKDYSTYPNIESKAMLPQEIVKIVWGL